MGGHEMQYYNTQYKESKQHLYNERNYINEWKRK